MFVIKRNGTREEVAFEKIHRRIKYLVEDPAPLPSVNVHTLAQTVIQGIYNGIKTTEIDSYSANVAASLSIRHREYGVLAGRIAVNNHQKNTLTSFKDKMDKLYLRKDVHGDVCPLLDDKFYKFVKKNQKEIEKHIDYSRDYLLDFFSFKTLEKGYLMKCDGVTVERPQDMFMRVSIFLHMNPKAWKSKEALAKVFESYDMMSQKYFTHATPTLFNAGSQRPQMASCYLLGTEDSLSGICKTATDCATISKWSGGIGFHFSNWRSKGALIRGTNGQSNGVIPFLRIFNDVARAFNQGGKRNGSFAAYIEPHHPDILSFLELKRNHGDENLRARDLFLALWISDLFMKRVKEDGIWSVFDPDSCPGLTDAYGDDYEKLYKEYEAKELYTKQYPAREVWKAIYTSQKESGVPYILYKDSVNRSNSQKNLGTIKSSNLCVTGNTLIPIRIRNEIRLERIDTLIHKNNGKHKVWNGVEWSEAQFAQTSESSKIVRVRLESETDRYNSIDCTLYHKFYIDDQGTEKLVTARDLTIGTKLYPFKDYFGELHNYTVVGLELQEESEPTYCFKEPKRGKGIFNGVLTGNCSEILLYSSSDEYAVCNLASLCLPMYVEDSYSPEELELPEEERRSLNHEFPDRPLFNYRKLEHAVDILVHNLNQVIDRNWYPTPETERSNMRHRPIGIGVQGLADVFFKFKTTYDSEVAKDLNRRIFETIYYASLTTSSKLCRDTYRQHQSDLQNKETIKINKVEYTKETLPTTIGAYSSFEGSPLSEGKFHFELRGLETKDCIQPYDWESLRAHIQRFGTRNSLLVALMPTASTSQIMGNIESIEPLTSNIFRRQTLAGEFIIVNKYLIHDLEEIGMWTPEMENYLKLNNGSIQTIDGIPDEIKKRYRTVWELSQKHIINLASDRQNFVDQSQSMNLFVEDLSFSKFNSMHFYGWEKGLKTGCYYLRSRPAVDAQKFTVDPSLKKGDVKQLNEYIPTQNDEDVCLVCSG